MMDWRTLVQAEELAERIDLPGLVVVDCRFDLRDAGAGERAYRTGHVPGAVYAHLDRDLSDQSKTGKGRHPLPDADAFCATLAQWGITPDTQVVAYDARDGAIAARLWWMLRLLGHARVAVLDGGLQAWAESGGRLDTAAPRSRQGSYRARYDVRSIVSTAVVAARMASGNGKLIDARARDRFRGELEPIDPVAGHVPGAVNRPYTTNLLASGRFHPRERLAEEFTRLLDGSRPTDAVMMCGSGVTACHNLLAMEHAGLGTGRVYAGSWSEWVSDPSRPVARNG